MKLRPHPSFDQFFMMGCDSESRAVADIELADMLQLARHGRGINAQAMISMATSQF